MHTPGAHVLKSVDPGDKMCTQGAGCTLNFELLLSAGAYIDDINMFIMIHI